MVALEGVSTQRQRVAGPGTHICGHYKVIQASGLVTGIEWVEGGVMGIVGRKEDKLFLSKGQQQQLPSGGCLHWLTIKELERLVQVRADADAVATGGN